MRLLLASGSQTNFITEHAVQMLGLKKHRISSSVSGIVQSKSKVNYRVSCIIQSRLNSYDCSLNCLVLPTITLELPIMEVDTSSWEIPSSILLADPWFHSPNRIDMLLGAEIFMNLLCIGQLKPAENANISEYHFWLGCIWPGFAQANRELHASGNMHCQYQFSPDTKLCEKSYTKTTRQND
ncbi:hypothetical protein PR048_027794 [Dryococelus australis]|uniref:Peptidase aspartic putative domain-containing protein n=1 Tax=Dryococelus australis TaxID=614101 RepID=A0ABQ9GHG0_9NEOP|nr:hypothetical protein PR048_027794 [Dryococelus australis]